VGGLLVQHISWESCFYVNIPWARRLIMSLLVLRENPRLSAASSFDIPASRPFRRACPLLIWA